MVATTLPGVLLTGIHSARPAANGVGTGTLYACSTHSLIYQSDGSSWSTWASLSGTGLANPMTTRGDIIIENATPAPARLAIGSTGKYLRTDGTDPSWQTPTEADLSTSDITTNNVSITKHGFAPKAPNDATKYLDGTGAYTVPAGGGGSGALAAHPMPLDAYAIDGTYGDDFTGASLSGLWTRRTFTSGEETYQLGQAATWMRINAASVGTAGAGYLQTAPAGDWTFACAFTRRGDGAVEVPWGLAVVDSSGTGVLFQHTYSAHSPWAPILVQLTTYTTYGGSYVEPGIAGAAPNVNLWAADMPRDRKMWLYLRKASGNYFAAYSLDGEVWSPETPALAWAGTVNRVGMLMGPLGTASGAGVTIDVDWFNKIA